MIFCYIYLGFVGCIALVWEPMVLIKIGWSEILWDFVKVLLLFVFQNSVGNFGESMCLEKSRRLTANDMPKPPYDDCSKCSGVRTGNPTIPNSGVF